jgi:hypothetical protein
MNRNLRVVLLGIGIAVLVVPAIGAQTRSVCPIQTSGSNRALALFDGTQPPAPNGPMKPPMKAA